MSIYILSLTYFTNDSVCYMQGIFEFPSWNDQGLVATKFRHWFNHVASKRWSDHKNRSLKGIWRSLGESAANFPPEQCDPGIWAQLIQQFKATETAPEGSTVK